MLGVSSVIMGVQRHLCFGADLLCSVKVTEKLEGVVDVEEEMRKDNKPFYNITVFSGSRAEMRKDNSGSV